MTDELEDLKKHIGNNHNSEDVVTASQVGRLAGALMVDHPAQHKGDPVPPGWHGAFFPGLAPLSNMRTDGQPKSGGPSPALMYTSAPGRAAPARPGAPPSPSSGAGSAWTAPDRRGSALRPRIRPG